MTPGRLAREEGLKNIFVTNGFHDGRGPGGRLVLAGRR